MTAPFELPIKLIEHDITEQWGQWTALWRSLLSAHHHSIRHHHLGLEHPVQQLDEPIIVDLLPQPSEQALMMNSVEEFLQIDVHHPSVTCL